MWARSLACLTAAASFSAVAQESDSLEGCARSPQSVVVKLREPAARALAEQAVDLGLRSMQYARNADGSYSSAATECYVLPRWSRDDHMTLQIFVRDMPIETLEDVSLALRKGLVSGLARLGVSNAVVTEVRVIVD